MSHCSDSKIINHSNLLFQKHVSWLPSVIFGIFAVLSAITLAFMPVTKGRDFNIKCLDMSIESCYLKYAV